MRLRWNSAPTQKDHDRIAKYWAAIESICSGWRSPASPVRTRAVALFVIALAAGACDSSESDREQIYQVALEHLLATDSLKPDEFLVAEAAEAPAPPRAGTPERQRLDECFHDAPDLPRLAAALEEANRVPRPIPGRLGQPPAVALVPAEQYRRDSQGRFSKQFLERYGKKRERHYFVPGLLTFSGVGSDSRARALVEINYTCSMCGFGMYLLLEKQWGWRWTVADSCETWVS